MKTKKLSKKLSLKKETIAHLEDKAMKNIQGGGSLDGACGPGYVALCKALSYYTDCEGGSCNTACIAGSCFLECWETEFCIPAQVPVVPEVLV